MADGYLARRRSLVFVLLVAGVFPFATSEARAQNQGLVERDGSLGSEPAGVVAPGIDPNGLFADYLIGSELGEQLGGNLFHSFLKFSVGSGEIATFTGPLSVENVISRVTGAEVSTINGMIRSTIDGADVFLINPRGVVFGPDSSLDIPGSFYTGTSDFLRLGETGRFDASDPARTILSFAAPSAFGFLGLDPAALSVEGGSLEVPSGETLALVGAGVRLLDASLRAPDGRIDIASVGAAGEVAIDVGSGTLGVDDIATLGTVEFSGIGSLDTAGAVGGAAVVRGQSIEIANDLSITASGANLGGSALFAADTIDVAGAITSIASDSAHGAAIEMQAEDVHVSGVIASRAEGAAQGGGIDVNATGSVLLSAAADRAFGTSIGSTTFGSGASGSIGAGGDVKIVAPTVRLVGSAKIGSDTEPGSIGAGGDLTLWVDDLIIESGGLINSGTAGIGAGGDLAIVATNSVEVAGFEGIPVDDLEKNLQGITSGTSGLTLFTPNTGNGGNLLIDSPELTLKDNGAITASSLFSSGLGGDITLLVDRLSVRGGGLIDSGALLYGKAGDISIEADEFVEIRGSSASDWPSRVRAFTTGNQDGGNISVMTPKFTVDGGALLTTNLGNWLLGGTGSAGNIEIEADTVKIEGGGIVDSSTFSNMPSFLGSTSGSGGSVTIRGVSGAASQVTITGAGSRLQAQTAADGDGGSVSVWARNLDLSDGGTISTRSGFGDPEILRAFPELPLLDYDGEYLKADNPEAKGSGGSIALNIGGALVIDSGELTSATLSQGHAGAVDVTAPLARLVGSAKIGSETEPGSGGDGGDLTLQVDDLIIESGGLIISGTAGIGAGGDLAIVATNSVEVAGFEGIPVDDLEKNLQGITSGTSGLTLFTPNTGNGGNLLIDSPELTLKDNGAITASSLFSSGLGGDITLLVDRLSVRGGGLIDSGALLYGKAGDISIEADEFVEIRGSSASDWPSRVRAFTTGNQDGGNISVMTPKFTVDGGALLTTNLGNWLLGGTGSAGNIEIEADTVKIEGGGIVDSSTFSNMPSFLGSTSGSGGSVTIRGVSGAASQVTITGAGSRLQAQTAADGDGGSVSVWARNLDLSDGGTISTRSGFGDPEILRAFPELPLLDYDGEYLKADNPEAKGSGGSIALNIGGALVINSSTLTSASKSKGDAGSILIGSTGDPIQRLRLSKSTIATSAEGAGGGDVAINVSESVLLERGSAITAGVKDGDGGSVTIGNPESVVLRDGSSIIASAEELGGSGGRIEIVTDSYFQERPDSAVDASAPGGPEVQGTVVITSPEVDVESQVTPLDAHFLDASALLRPGCAARAGAGREGSFVVVPGRGLQSSPEGMLLAFEAFDGARLEVADESSALPAAATSAAPVDGIAEAGRALSEGSAAFRRRDFERASERWSLATDLYRRGGDDAGRGDALRALGQAQHALAQYETSVETFGTALALAEQTGPGWRIAAALGGLGNAYLALGRLEAAEAAFDRSIGLAKAAGRSEIAAALVNDLGNVHAARQSFDAALAAYEEGAALARDAQRPLLEVKALANAARAALEANRASRAVTLLEQAAARAALLPNTRSRRVLQINVARSYELLAMAAPAYARSRLLAAQHALVSAIESAQQADDDWALAFALGNLGRLYEAESRSEEALYLTRQAMHVAARADAHDSLYRWYWQEARLLWAQGRANEAVAAYRRAVEILAERRPEARAHYGSTELRFRRAVAPVYLDLVEALLEGSDLVADRVASKRLLIEARSTMEQLRAAELRDYYRDECVAEIEAKTRGLETVAANAAVVYPIVLPDRLELLVSLPSGIERYTLAVGAREVARTVDDFQRALMQPTIRSYRKPAEQLYDWLVRPYASRLVQEEVETLVFVPDGRLRTIPMAALHDGSDFLIGSYALAVTPGLSLVDPKPLDRKGAKLLLAGLSEPIQGFEAIPNAMSEIEAIRALYGGSVLLNQAFATDRFESELATGQPTVVHLASHAVFTGDPATSFLLTHDGRLTMDGIADVVAPTRFRRQPLELLVLSACETASGDERAALGLAGVAIRAGARSALGSLWRVHDQASYELMVAFYEELKASQISKAEALRRAQRRLMQDRRFAHPYYWSAFMLISNWL